MKKLIFLDLKRLQLDYERLCTVHDLVEKCNGKFYFDKEIESFMSELSKNILNLVCKKQGEIGRMQTQFLKYDTKTNRFV